MFSKSWEVSKIFQRVEKGDISPFKEVPWWKFCRVFFITFFLQIVIALGLLIGDPIVADSYVLDPLNLIAVRNCKVGRGGLWFGLEGTFFGILSIWGAYLAYQTRLVWARYKYPNESRSILLSLYNLLLSSIIILPFFSVTDGSEDTIFVFVCFAIMYPTGFCLSMVYVPKLASFLGSSFKKSKESKAKSSDRGSVGGSRTAKRIAHHDDDSRLGVKSTKKEESHAKEKKDEAQAKEKAQKDEAPKRTRDDAPRFFPEPETPTHQLKELPALNTPAPAGGGWRVLVNPVANENEISESVFDSPEAAAKSKLLS
jgi:hypothetical protein